MERQEGCDRPGWPASLKAGCLVGASVHYRKLGVLTAFAAVLGKDGRRGEIRTGGGGGEQVDGQGSPRRRGDEGREWEIETQGGGSPRG